MNRTFRLRLCLALATASASSLSCPAAPPRPRPNIVLLLADDQGWNGLSVAMHPDMLGSRSDLIQTPNIERLAAQGMRFSNAYAPAPVCSPTRISLQTGKSPARLHWTKAAPPEPGHRLVEPVLAKQIPAAEVTVGELLKRAGYATAHYGKWHLASGGPGRHGYDEHDGDTGNEHAHDFTDPNPVDIFGMARRAEAFMDASRRAGKPFFVQLSWNALHAPGNALRATREKYAKLTGSDGADRRVAVAAISEDLDTGVGMVLDAVDRLGLADDTIVISTSDNGAGGGGGRRGGLGGGKGSVWEGGTACRSSSAGRASPPARGATCRSWATTCCRRSAPGRACPGPRCRGTSTAAALPTCSRTAARGRCSGPATNWCSTFRTTRAVTRPTRRSAWAI
ncbi:MAG: sulfatase [Planctomycetes bacterium]|nr:sulfatase [Planctomycetota bacterium]